MEREHRNYRLRGKRKRQKFAYVRIVPRNSRESEDKTRALLNASLSRNSTNPMRADFPCSYPFAVKRKSDDEKEKGGTGKKEKRVQKKKAGISKCVEDNLNKRHVKMLLYEHKFMNHTSKASEEPCWKQEKLC